MLLFLPQRSANTTQRSSNIYDFKCTATERKHCFRFLLRRSFYLLPAPSLILHLVILISNMFAVCSICVCLCILPCRLFCFVLFLVVLCSQFAYLSADLLIISKYTQHTLVYAYCAMCNVYQRTIRGALLPSANQRDAHFLEEATREKTALLISRL